MSRKIKSISNPKLRLEILTPAEVQKIRADAMVNFCPNCGRILVYDRAR